MQTIKSWLSADWPAPEHIQAGITLRQGGTSTGAFASLNAASHVGDEQAKVIANRSIIGQLLELPAEPAWLNQVHGTEVVNADKLHSGVADASFTSSHSTVCAVMTADCLPVLLCDPAGSCVAAIHAGWKGLLAGVIENTVKHLPAKSLMAWLGPAIGPECFEVGEPVRHAFLQKSQDFESAFLPYSNGKWLANIYQLATLTLNKVNISSIYGGGLCTVCDSDNFYSYRRDGVTGRMASLIWIS